MSKYEDSTHTQHQLAIIQGLKQLRYTNRWCLAPLSEAQIESKEVEEYLSRGLDEDISADSKLEKDIVTAVYLAVKRSKWKPRFSAKVLAKQAIEELRAARLTTLYHDNRIDARRYKEECENNYVMNTLSVARRVKKRYGRKAIKTGITLGLFLAGLPYAATAAGGVLLADAILPKKYKEKVKKQAKKVAKAAASTVKRGLTLLKEKGRKAAERVAEKLVETVQTANRMAQPVVEATRTFVEAVKEKGKKVLKFLFG